MARLSFYKLVYRKDNMNTVLVYADLVLLTIKYVLTIVVCKIAGFINTILPLLIGISIGLVFYGASFLLLIAFGYPY